MKLLRKQSCSRLGEAADTTEAFFTLECIGGSGARRYAGRQPIGCLVYHSHATFAMTQF